jgi:hypothetical protein
MTGTPRDTSEDADTPLSDDLLPEGPGSDEGSDPNDPDGQMYDQQMPTTDGQMSSNSSEEVIPPRA